MQMGEQQRHQCTNRECLRRYVATHSLWFTADEDDEDGHKCRNKGGVRESNERDLLSV